MVSTWEIWLRGPDCTETCKFSASIRLYGNKFRFASEAYLAYPFWSMSFGGRMRTVGFSGPNSESRSYSLRLRDIGACGARSSKV